MENKTLFGELPLGWKHVALSDVTTFISRGRQPKYIASVEGIPVINQKMIRNFTIDYRYVKYNDAKKNINKSVFIKIGDTLVNSTGVGTVGRSAYISIDPMRPTFVDSHVTIVRPDTAIVDPKFMSVVLSSDVYSNYMGSTLAQGSTGQVELSRQKLSKMCIPFPPLNTQHLIGTIFDLIDQKIKLNQQINKNLLQMMENCYRKMLKNAIYNHQSKQSNILTVADNIITGKTPSTKNPGYYGGDTPFITIPDMQGNVFVTVTKKRLTQSGTSVQQNKEIPALSLNVSCIGTVGLVTINPTVAHTNQQINSVIVSKDKLWELFFELRSLKGVMENMASGGTTILNMNKAIFSKLQINLLSPAIRKQFNAYANPIFEQILINDEQNHKLAKVRDLLLPKLLAGQIDLSNLEGAIQNA